MVAIVTGNGVGLGKSSSEVLGQGGQIGLGQLPGAAGNAYVNAATGNLVIRRQDEVLIGRGPDIGVYQTYNSQGGLDFDNNDNWQVSLYRQLSGLTGTVNTAGSTITRTGADGTALVYTYDSTTGSATVGKYVNKDGAGSYDTLSYDGTNKVWTWQDGTSRIKESYAVDPNDNSKWRITNVTDLDGNSLTYSYSTTTGLTGLIDKVTTANGEVTQLIYNASKQLTQINLINSSNVTTTRIRYTYESTASTARLTSVSTDLTPADGSITDNNTYTTTYTYDGTSKRIASITNSDGSKVSFSYEQSGDNRLLSINEYSTNSDSISNATTLNYTSATTTTVTTTNNAGTSLVTTLTYDSNKQLTNIKGPTDPQSTSSSGQNVSYTYNANGDVTQVTDSRGNWTKYSYDAQGNQVTQQDNLGNTITRTYGANNQLLSQTVYSATDSTPTDNIVAASGGQTTRYVYSTNGKNQLRYQISAEGRVTEYRYNSNGQLENTLQYTAGSFDLNSLPSFSQDFSSNSDGFSPSPLPAGFALVNGALQITSTRQASNVWTGIGTPAQDMGTRFSLDISTQTLSSTLLSAGLTAGTFGTPGYRRLWVTLEGSTLVLQTRIGGTVVNRNIGTVKANTNYVVEALTDSNGMATLYFYEKGQSRNNGYTASLDLGGSKPGFALEAFSGSYAASSMTTTNTIRVDNFRMQKEPQESDLTAWVGTQDLSKLQRTDYGYDVRGQLSSQSQYTATDNTGAGLSSGKMTTQYTYDAAGNLLQKIDARGVATTGVANDYLTSYAYDGLNRLTLTKQYDQSGLEANAVSSQVTYTDASRQVSLTLANGLVTTSTYDLAGRLLTVQKSDATNPTVGSLGTTSYAYDKLGNLRSVTNELGKVTYYLYDNANRKVGEIDENKNLTEWVYNNNGQVVRTIQYKKAVTATLDATTALTNTLATNGIRSLDSTNDRTSYKIYDQAGRLAKEINALGYVTEYQYDGASRLLKTIEYANALTTTQLNAINAASGELQPADSNTVPVADATNDRAKRNLYDNDGKLVGSLDAEGYLTEYVYDKAGRKTQMIRYATVTNASNWVTGDLATLRGNATSVSADTTKHQTTNYIYDAAGQLTGVVDAEGYLTEYQYDLAGNKTQEIRYATNITYVAGNTVEQSRPTTNPEDYAKTWSYDANNRLVAMMNSDGLITGYRYDNVGNLIATMQSYNGANSTDFRVKNHQYDSRGNLVAELNAVGTQILWGLNNPTQSQLDNIWNTYGTRYTYDNGNRLLSKVEPNGVNATGNKTLYYYDNEGKLTYTVNALGEVSQTVYNSFDQVSETRRYNTRIASTTLAGLVGGDDSALASAISGINAGGYSSVQAAYDQAGQRITSTDELGNINSRRYNAFGELKDKTDKIDSSTSVVTSYQYDRRGSLKQTKEDDGGINRITSAIYDAFGRVTQTTDGRNNTQTYQYDKLGRTIVTTNGLSQSTTIGYDAFDRKVSQVDGRGNPTTWVYNTTNRSMTMTTAEGISVITERNAFGEVVKVTDGRGSITSYQYNTDGQLTNTIEDSGSAAGKLNLSTSTTYDKAGRVYQTTDARGTVTQYSYDAANRVLSKTIDPTSVNANGLNLSSNYRYDAQGRQIWSQDANGIWTRMDYDAKGQLSQVVTDPTDIPTTDANGLVTGTATNANALNLITRYSYDARGKKLSVTEGYNTTSARTTQYVYDKLGRLTSTIVDPGTNKLNLTTSYTYDQNDNVVLKTDAKGNKTVYSYDAEDRLVYTVDALGYITKNDYDGNGNIVKVRQYKTALAAATLTTLQGAPSSTSITPTDSSDDRVTRYAYDKDNRRTYITDAEWYVTRNEYDANGNVVKRTQYATKATVTPDNGTAPTVASDAVKDRVTQTVYDAADRATYSVDAQGYVTANRYDANGNIVSTTRYATVMVGTLSTNTPPQILTAAGSGNYVVTSSNDRISQTVYDSANRASYQLDALGYLTELKYDNNGNITKRTRFYNKMVGTLTTNVAPQVLDSGGSGNYILRNSNDRITVNTWDEANRLQTTQSGADAQITYTYDAVGNRIQATQNWVNTRYNYDAAGRMVDEMRGYGTMSLVTTHYNYDALGNQTGITEGYGTSVNRYTGQSFDALGRKIQVTDGNGKSTKTEYNAFGDIVKVTDANNKAGYFYVDKRGLVTLQVNPDGAATSTAYDAFGGATTITAYATRITASLTTSASPAVTNSGNDQKQILSYDRLGNKTGVQTYWGTGANDYYTEGYGYNAFGEAISVKARNGAYTNYDYDKLGRKIQETLPVTSLDANGAAKAVINTFGYDALGNLSAKTEASGLPEARTTTYSYDKSNRLTKEQKQTFTAFNPVTNQEESVTPTVNKTYDVFGRLTTETDFKGNKTWYYYDVLNRQVGKVDASGVYTFTNYDAVGNKTSETVYANKVLFTGNAVQSTNSAPTIVTAIPASTSNAVYVLADNDNDRTTYYSYDGVGRLTATDIQNIRTGVYNASTGYEISTGNITTQNVYDAMGNLVKQITGATRDPGTNAITGGNITRNWYNNAGQLAAKQDAEGYLTTWTRDVYGNITRETRYAIKPANAATNPLNITDSTTLAQITTTAATLGSSDDRITDMTFDRLNRTVTETVKSVMKGSVDSTGVLTAASAGDVVTRYDYNGLNNITQKTDATGAVTNYIYDNIGRKTAELKPTITDYTGATVRPETDWEYDGLNNVKRELRRGTNNTASSTTLSKQEESDDQITRYEYGTNGLLLAETDATDARTEYRYDANGNITKETLKNRRTADQVANSQAGADDVKTYTYDALNRQIKTADVGTSSTPGTGVVQEVQYSSFGQITGKRTYTTTTAPQTATTWDEYTQYDRAGRVWKSNAGDGVTKVTVSDLSGNATVRISGTLDMRNMTLDQVLAQKQLDETNKIQPQTLYTFSVYDKKNQLVNTIQPSTDGMQNSVKVVQITDTNQSLVVTAASSGSMTGSSGVRGNDPVTAGGVVLIGGLSLSGTFTYGIVPVGLTGRYQNLYVLNFNALNSTQALGNGQLKVQLDWISGQNGSLIRSDVSFVNDGSAVSSNLQLQGALNANAAKVRINITKLTQGLGEISLLRDYYPPITSGGNTFVAATSVQYSLISQGQPPSTSKLLLSYRPAGSNGAFTTVSVPQMFNTSGAPMAGMYAFDWSGLSGNYEFQYVALDSNGQILNQQSGSFNTSNPNAPTVSAQTPLAIGGPGRAFFSNSGINGMGSGLQLINQGADAASVEMRYRLKNSNGDWLTPATSFAANNSFGTGSFVLDPAGLSGMVNGNQYDIQFIIKNSSGAVLRTATGSLTKDASGFNISPLQVAAKLTFTQPTSAQTLELRYRLVNTGSYSAPIRLTTIGNGQFEWDPTNLISDPANNYDYDFDIQALDTDGMLVNHNQVTVRLGATTSQLGSQIIALPQVLRIKPTQTGINYMQLSYRAKGSSANYTSLNVNVVASTNADGSKEYRFQLPPGLTAGDYEYRYTAYAADTVDSNGDPVQNALGSSTGYFTAGTTGSASRLDWVIATTGNTNNPAPKISRSQSYNAFGDIVTETDGRDNVTRYTYNTLGAMTKKEAPKVSITAENGAVNDNATPTTEYTYDAIGRVIAVKDANGNLNTQVWLAGASADGNITLEKHADGGIKAAGFDIFGNKRTEYDELASSRTTSAADAIHRTDYSYDKENRLIKVEHQARNDGSGIRSTDQYTYDAAGNRISHTNAASDTEKTNYDSLGRVTKTISFMGFETSYAYTYLNNLTGVGGATVGGWQKTTTDATLRTLIDNTDMFNHLTWHQDLGGHQFTYVYNQAGWLMSQTSLGAGTQYSGQNIAYTYYNNGFIKSIHDKAVGMYTYYEYDKDGNKTFEGYISLKDAANYDAGAKDYYQYASITYDAMNRMTSVIDPKASISYEYDAVGNRRMVKSVYHDGVNGSMQVQEYWYKYDSMNRFLITMGILNGTRGGTSTSISKGSTGVDITYNFLGQRTQAINGSDNTKENYSYTNDGYLTDVNINGTLSSRRSNDALGRVYTYQQFGSNASNKTTTYDKDNRVTQETGSDGTTNYYYYTDKNDSASATNGAGQLGRVENTKDTTTVNTYYAYQYWDDAKQFAITNQGYNPTLRGNNNFWKPGYSELKYDVNGHLVGANDAGNDGIRGTADDRNFRYVNDAQGLILLRDEIAGGTINRVQRFYYVDGKRIGDVGNDGDVRTDYVQAMANRKQSKADYKNWKPVSSADFDQNYEPVSPSYPGFAATTYTVKNGDTLQSIARTVWGDADMWYLIADANGLTNSNTLTAGQVLTIPNKVTNIHNNSGTYRVYNPGEAIGDVNPTLPTAPPVPKKKKKGCGGFASIIVAAVAVVATIYTAGALSSAIAAQGGALTAGLGATMSAGVSALGAAGAAGGLSFGAAFAAGAAGSIAGQLAGNALGVQSGFSWGAVATAGLTSGILSTSPMNALTQAVGGAVNGGYAAVAARAVIGNVVSQGIGNVTGSQKGFSWSSVAISSIGAAAGAAISDKLQLNGISFGENLGRAVISSGSFALTQLAISGGKVNWQQVATDTVTNLIQNQSASSAAKKSALETPTYGATFDEDMQSRKQALNLAGTNLTDSAVASPSQLRLSDDEVISNALARQEAKGFNGLNVSWTDSPAQQNAKNGGLNVGYSTARDEGVFFNSSQNSLPASFKQTAGLTNAGTTGLISRNPPVMNGISSLYYQRDALTGLYIDPLSNQPSARISMEVQRKINDASAKENLQTIDYGNHRLEIWDVAGDRAAAQQLEQTRGKLGAIVGGPNAAIALSQLGMSGASYYLGLNLSARRIMLANGITAGGAKAYTNVVDKGEVRLPSVIFASGLGMLGGQIGAPYGILTNGAIGAGSSVIDTAYNNWTYGDNDEYLYNAGLSFVGGSAGKYADKQITTFLQLKSLPITYSNISNFNYKAPVTGGVKGAVISNTIPVVFREKKAE